MKHMYSPFALSNPMLRALETFPQSEWSNIPHRSYLEWRLSSSCDRFDFHGSSQPFSMTITSNESLGIVWTANDVIHCSIYLSGLNEGMMTDILGDIPVLLLFIQTYAKTLSDNVNFVEGGNICKFALR